MVIRTVSAAVLVAALVSGLAACGSGPDAAGPVSVVASTNVWGDVATQVAGRLAGPRVRVTSVISDPNTDPHSFEPSARTALAIRRADVLVENGGGYDDFMTTLREGSGTHAAVLDAVAISGRRGPDVNEHVWYDFPTVARVAGRLAAALAAADPSHASTYRANARTFTSRLAGLERTEAAIRAARHGAGVAITEPVPLYLLAACGLVNRTPPAFTAALEGEGDVSARVLQQTLALFSRHAVRLLVYNAQTSGQETDRVRAAARSAGIPAVPVTESLPAGTGYLTWMTRNLSAIGTALAGPTA